jgi:cation diffusion facilitator family transporter
MINASKYLFKDQKVLEVNKQIADREKSSAALGSVFAAIGLTLMKIIVGVTTGSLGILAEAAHSALDLTAALVTLAAVRLSGKPADSEHRYGHGKIENLSALFETFLLLVTCVWIIYEAIQRFFFKQIEIEVSYWAFLVMFISIVVDYYRSKNLSATAKKHNSQALEADGLHFKTDIWSSSVVIFGLLGTYIAEKVEFLGFLKHADIFAALGVALIVIYVSIQLGIRTIKGLLDSNPPGLAEDIILEVNKIPGVIDIHDLRIRDSGPNLFVDAHVHVNGNQLIGDAHALTEAIEAVITKVVPGADILIHPEPADEIKDEPEIQQKIIEVVESLQGVSDCHEITTHYYGSKLYISTHVLVDGNKNLIEAHLITEAIEKNILHLYPGAIVSIHPEPILDNSNKLVANY